MTKRLKNWWQRAFNVLTAPNPTKTRLNHAHELRHLIGCNTIPSVILLLYLVNGTDRMPNICCRSYQKLEREPCRWKSHAAIPPVTQTHFLWYLRRETTGFSCTKSKTSNKIDHTHDCAIFRRTPEHVRLSWGCCQTFHSAGMTIKHLHCLPRCNIVDTNAWVCRTTYYDIVSGLR